MLPAPHEERRFAPLERATWPEPRHIAADTLCFCEHAFLSQQNRPCYIAVMDQVTFPTLPLWRPILTVAAQVRSYPNTELRLKVEFGVSMDDIMRQSHLPPLRTTPRGDAFVVFAMPQLKFDVAGSYIARLRDITDENYLFAFKTIQIRAPHLPWQ